MLASNVRGYQFCSPANYYVMGMPLYIYIYNNSCQLHENGYINSTRLIQVCTQNNKNYNLFLFPKGKSSPPMPPNAALDSVASGNVCCPVDFPSAYFFLFQPSVS